MSVFSKLQENRKKVFQGAMLLLLLILQLTVLLYYADRKAGITRNVLVDKEGKIVMLTRLYNEEEFASLCKKIDEMLAE